MFGQLLEVQFLGKTCEGKDCALLFMTGEAIGHKLVLIKGFGYIDSRFGFSTPTAHTDSWKVLVVKNMVNE